MPRRCDRERYSSLRYGFVIDQNRCIGCHACTVACKEEHSVPVGVFRTWVKYIEKGEFPDASRHFGVMRCNHCDAAPCVEICPTSALFYRPDRIVDFDNSRCIGCKSCMQACPYDALYIDPNSNTAAKCNFCAHRIEMELEPACVIVCPTQAIIAGDLDDPASSVSRIVATQKVAARKPQKGTQPKLFYTGIEGDFLQPSMMEQEESQMWAERSPASNPYSIEPSRPEPERNGKARTPGAARVVYDVAHKQPWGAIPAFYLWTKSIAAGALIVAAILLSVSHDAGARGTQAFLNLAAPAVAIAFLGLTVLLLIADLHRPDRFYFILTKPNWRSWLVRGTWVLAAYGMLSLAWIGYGFFRASIPPWLFWIAAVAGAGSACYSAFLFAQAKGRDLWQSPLFLWHLLAQAILAGAAILIILAAAAAILHITDLAGEGLRQVQSLDRILIASLALSALMVLGEVSLPPFSEDVHRATRLLISGALSRAFWLGFIGAGTALPIIALWLALDRRGPDLILSLGAAVLALGGLLIFETLWIVAGQAPALS